MITFLKQLKEINYVIIIEFKRELDSAFFVNENYNLKKYSRSNWKRKEY